MILGAHCNVALHSAHQEEKCFGINKFSRTSSILGLNVFQGPDLAQANCWIKKKRKKKAPVFHSRCIPLCFMQRCECPGMCENGAKHTIALTSLFSTPSELKKLRNNEMCMPQYPDPLLAIVCNLSSPSDVNQFTVVGMLAVQVSKQPSMYSPTVLW